MTSSRRVTSTTRSARGTQRAELQPQLERHLFRGRDAHESAQRDLEPVALVAPTTPFEVCLRLAHLFIREDPVEVRLHHLFAVTTSTRHHTTAFSARFCFNARRPRCRRDMTVPTGMSRICAAS